MALKYAVSSGNWSDAGIWNDGTLPTSEDTVRANGFQVTIDQDVSVQLISAVASAPAVHGGNFLLTSTPPEGRVIDSDIQGSHISSTLIISAEGGSASIKNVFMSGNSASSNTFWGGVNILAREFTLTAENIYAFNLPSSAGNDSTAVVFRDSNATLICNDIYGGQATRSHGIAASWGGSPTIIARDLIGWTQHVITSSSVPLKISCRNVYAASSGAGIFASSTLAIIDIYGDCHASNGYVAVDSATPYLRIHGALYSAPNNRLPIRAAFFQTTHEQKTIMTINDDSNGTAGGVPVTITDLPPNDPDLSDIRKGYRVGISDNLVGTMAVPDKESVSYLSKTGTDNGESVVSLKDASEVASSAIQETLG